LKKYGIPSPEAQISAYKAGYLLHATKIEFLPSIIEHGLGQAWFSSTERDAGDQPGEILLALHRDNIPKLDKYGEPSISPHSGYYINSPSQGDSFIPASNLKIFTTDDKLEPLCNS